MAFSSRIDRYSRIASTYSLTPIGRCSRCMPYYASARIWRTIHCTTLSSMKDLLGLSDSLTRVLVIFCHSDGVYMGPQGGCDFPSLHWKDVLASGRNFGLVPAYHHSLRFGWLNLASRNKISCPLWSRLRSWQLYYTSHQASHISFCINKFRWHHSESLTPSTRTHNGPGEVSGEKPYDELCVTKRYQRCHQLTPANHSFEPAGFLPAHNSQRKAVCNPRTRFRIASRGQDQTRFCRNCSRGQGFLDWTSVGTTN